MPPPVVWFTGLPSAGKTTIGRTLVTGLRDDGLAAELIDGDELRAGDPEPLGFTAADRLEQARRAVAAALRARERGAIAVVATISPYARGRRLARELIGDGFLEVHVDAPLTTCEARDRSGLYAAARRGAALHVTGISDPYEPPRTPDLRVESGREDPAACAARIAWLLRERAGVR